MLTIAAGQANMDEVQLIRIALATLATMDFQVRGAGPNQRIKIPLVGLENIEHEAARRAAYASKTEGAECVAMGISVGLVKIGDFWFDQACVVVAGSNGGADSRAFSAPFPLPTKAAEMAAREGILIETALGLPNGTLDPVGYLSVGCLRRRDLLLTTIQCALIPRIKFANYV